MPKRTGLFVSTLVVLFAVCNALAQNSLNVTMLGATVSSSVMDALLIGDTGYVGLDKKLLIYDFSNPQARKKIGEISFPSAISYLFPLDKHLLVGADKLYIYNLESVVEPQLVSSLAVSGQYPNFNQGLLYLCSSGNVKTIDLHDLANPVLVADQIAGTYITGLAFQDSLMFAASQMNGLYVYDISDPKQWKQVSIMDTPGFVNCLAIRDHYLFLTDGNVPGNERGLRVIDISRPDSLKQVAFLPTAGDAWSIVLQGNYAYISDHPGLRIIDIANPLLPIEKNYLDMSWINEIHLSNNRLVLVEQYTSGIYELSDPLHPAYISTFAAGHGASAGSAVALHGAFAYLADKANGVRAVTIADPTDPYQLNQIDTPGTALDVVVDSAYAYVADGANGLRIIDISDPLDLKDVGFLDTPGTGASVAVKDHFAYIVDGTSGIRVVDVSNPTTPQEVSFFDTPAKTTGIAIQGNTAYVTDYTLGLRILNISDPKAVTELGVVDTPGYAYDVAVSGSYAYIADGGKGLRIIDVSNPAVPVEAGFYDTAGTALAIAVSESYVYVADSNDGVRIFDVSQPANPQEVAYYDTPGQASGVVISGSLAYVADGTSMLVLRNDLLTLVQSPQPGQPKAYALLQNFPNPFNASTRIAFNLLHPARVILGVYDIAGRKVATLLDEQRSTGLHQVQWSAGELPSGIYFCRLQAGPHQVMLRQMVLVR